MKVWLDFDFTRRRYGAKITGDIAEWPPHPARVFQAITAVAHQHKDYEPVRDQTRALLVKLEHCQPPSIWTPPIIEHTTPSTWVPIPISAQKRNESGDSRRAKPIPETHFGTLSTVRFEWDVPDMTPEEFNLLRDVCSGIVYLGRRDSEVDCLCSEATGTPTKEQFEKVWYPRQKQGDLDLRVPYVGYLRELDGIYNQQTIPQNEEHKRPYKSYYVSGATKQDRRMLQTWLLQGETEITATAALVLTDALHKLFASLLGKQPSHVQEQLRGTVLGVESERRKHLAIHPLITTNQNHHPLRGFGVSVPQHLDTPLLSDFLSLVDNERVYFHQAQGAVEFELHEVGRTNLKTLDRQTWARPHRTWASVTPVWFFRHLKKNRTPDDVVRHACQEAGLPDPIEIHTSKYSFLKGPRVGDLRHRRGHDLQKEPVFHIHMTFEKPIEGPICLGREAHLGLGFFQPCA